MGTGAILVLNAGSSSIKFALYDAEPEPRECARGLVENLGPCARMKLELPDRESTQHELGAADHTVALKEILSNTNRILGQRPVIGVGHRIAHGGIEFVSATHLDDETLAKLRALKPLAPLHQPHNLAAVDAAKAIFPQAMQIGCFDTAFHRGHPWVNDTFALPRRYYDKGVRRYGFHGLSYQYVSGALSEVAPAVASGRVIIAHLGNGASMCALRDHRSMGSTMGFSALDGLPMGTRCGQLDPGVLLYLMDQEKMTSAQIEDLLYLESGLQGLSGFSNDMRTLEASDRPEARQAIDYFVFRIRRELGAMCAVLGGLDAVVFCGGIGENSAAVRSGVCNQMDWIGLSIDEEQNKANATCISNGKVPVLVIRTDEERVIARSVANMLEPA